MKMEPAASSIPSLMYQRGIVRSNCIDCLDRTNVAQWCIGMRILACQLYVLGVDLCNKRTNGKKKPQKTKKIIVKKKISVKQSNSL